MKKEKKFENLKKKTRKDKWGREKLTWKYD